MNRRKTPEGVHEKQQKYKAGCEFRQYKREEEGGEKEARKGEEKGKKNQKKID